MSLMLDSSVNLSEPIAIIVGAVIAAASGFGAVLAQTKFQRITDRKGLVGALLGEIKSLQLVAKAQRYDEMLVYGIEAFSNHKSTLYPCTREIQPR